MTKQRLVLVVVGALATSCGARSALHDRSDAGTRMTTDAAVVRDAAMTVDAAITRDAPGPHCTLGPFIEMATAVCGGDEVDFFASPYTPPSDITVARIEAHMRHGHVALLESAGGAPGRLLFMGSVGMSTMPSWLGTDVSPPVVLRGGVPYFIAFQGGCSFSVGGTEPVEYMAASLDGPWHVQGTDNWTARLIGTCP